MTVDYKIDAMFELRKFLWAQLKLNNMFNQNDYYSDNLGTEIVPIVPVQQHLATGNGSHLVSNTTIVK